MRAKYQLIHYKEGRNWSAVSSRLNEVGNAVATLHDFLYRAMFHSFIFVLTYANPVSAHADNRSPQLFPMSVRGHLLEPSGIPTYFYVARSGSDLNPGTLTAPFQTLTGASQAVRAALTAGMNGDIVVYLRGGTHTLTSTITLGARDSGVNGYSVYYSSYPNETAIISGGIPVAGWSLYDSKLNIYRSYVGKVAKFRQLYVNGHHAQVARRAIDPTVFSRTPAGFSTTDAAILEARNATQLEVVILGNWMINRCKVASISGSNLIMQNPCWANAQWADRWGAKLPSWVENAYEFLDQPGAFYLDRSSGYVYYIPLLGEDIATAEVIAPALENMIVGSKAQNIHFVNLAFEHSTWLGPDTPDGYVGVQQGYHKIGPSGALARMQSPIEFSNSTNIVFSDDLFTLLGSRALNFDGGSQMIRILNSSFVENAGGAIQFGQNDDASNTNVAGQNNGVVIQNNSISATSFEYLDDAAINAGYVAHMKILHNVIHNIPGFGIAIGWGWGTPSYARDNEVGFNYIENFSETFTDSAAIYTLSSQPGMTVHDNYMHIGNIGYGCIYPDEGSSYEKWTNNVCRCVNQFVHIWSSSSQNNTITGNFTDSPNVENNGVNNTISGNVIVTNSDWPPAAIQIMNSVGLISTAAPDLPPTSPPRCEHQPLRR